MNPIRPVALKVGGQPWLPRFAKYIVAVDRGLRKLTRGRVTLLTFAGLPELFLTVPGRKSGIPRTTPLLCVPYRGGWLIAGSNWGHPKPPMWVGNLAAASEAIVEFRGRETTVRPRRLEGADRVEVWPVMLETWPNYQKYTERTDREIPVFLLEPTGG